MVTPMPIDKQGVVKKQLKTDKMKELKERERLLERKREREIVTDTER